MTCANGGVCENDTCRCPAGFEGLTCEIETRQKFEGPWTVVEHFRLDSISYEINIDPAINGVANIVIHDLYQEVTELTVNGYVSGDSLIIPMQYTNGQMIIGAGYISDNQTNGQQGIITMRYAVKDTAAGGINDYGYYSPTDSPSVWIPPGLF